MFSGNSNNEQLSMQPSQEPKQQSYLSTQAETLFTKSTKAAQHNETEQVTNFNPFNIQATPVMLPVTDNFQAPRQQNNSDYMNSKMSRQTNSRFKKPMKEMLRRWKQIIEKNLPAIDLIDLAAEHNTFNAEKRQFAPEYSQQAYQCMLRSELAIGDYIDFYDKVMRVSDQSRRHMVTLLEDLNRRKGYKEETLYLAASLCDRYLVNLAINNRKAPCLIKLAIICTLMAAKLD